MKVLIVGSGGREHALAWKISQSPKLTQLFCAPGNGGIAQMAECVDIKAEDVEGLFKFAKKMAIDLTIVGPEVSLVAGIVDRFAAAGLMIFGPSQAAARLEGSKVFAKEFMHRRNIPTAVFQSFKKIEAARRFVEQAEFPLVVKADGLAAGKGVFVCSSIDEAKSALDQIMKQKVFAEAGNCVVIEECLQGEEVSILAISDGEHYVILEPAQDHKRIFDDDLGPNTGGMGAYCPATIVSAELLEQIDARVIEPTIRGMQREGIPFRGVLYAGLMVGKDGPKVLEFNVRFGDPETQAVLPRLKSDLLEVMLAACANRLNQVKLNWDPRTSVCVVMSSGGYPGDYEKGKEISGLEQALEFEDVAVFHAGTRKQANKILTDGGRVLGVTGLGQGLEKAIEKTYEAVEQIHFDRCFFRRDIGAKGMKKAEDSQFKKLSRMKGVT